MPAPTTTPGPVEAYMTADHARLDALLRQADPGDGGIEPVAFDAFRRGLLKHIAMEEKVLIRFARDKRGSPLPIASRLRVEHGTIASLLVPTPTPELCDRLRAVLAAHNPLEEGADGLYAQCDALAGDGAAAVVERLRAMPEVPVAKHYDGPLLHRRSASDPRRTPGEND